RVRHARGVEPLALVGDADHHLLRIHAKLDAYRFPGIALVSVQDRVGQGFGDTDPEVQLEARPLEGAGTAPAYEVADGRLDHAQIARELKRDFGGRRPSAFLTVGSALPCHDKGGRVEGPTYTWGVRSWRAPLRENRRC